MNKEIKAAQAHHLKEEIIRIKNSMGKGYFLLGELLKKIRDERLYRLLDCNTMTEFIAQPELAFSRSSVYDYIKLYEIFIEKLNMPEIADIPYSQLRRILPVVESDPEEWISKARTLSRADLALEVGDAKDTREGAEWEKRPDLRPPLKLNASRSVSKIFLNLIKQIDICPVCGKQEDLTLHHFPRTKARLDKKDEWKCIPICLECHETAQVQQKEWLYTNRIRIFDFFYYIALECVKLKLKEE